MPKTFAQQLLERNKGLFVSNESDSALDLFEGRSFFERFQFDNIEFEQDTVPPKPRNLWGLDYGLKDTFGDPVYPHEDHFKEVPADDLQVLMDFVADAFQDFHEYFKEGRSQNLIDTGDESTIPYIKAKRGWEDGEQQYAKFVDSLLTVFFEQEINETSKFEDTLHFWGFVEELKKFFQKMTQYPFSRMIYFSSPFANPFSSGLVVEVKERRYGDHRQAADFYADPNYQFYASSARRFGFVLDKNAPWRLYADLASPRMQSYMQDYDLNTPQQVFEERFRNLFEFELANIRDLLVEYYNNYIVEIKEKEKRVFKKCSDGSYRSYQPNIDIITRERYNSFDKREFLPFLGDIAFDFGSYVRRGRSHAKRKQKTMTEAHRLMESVGETEAVRTIYQNALP